MHFGHCVEDCRFEEAGGEPSAVGVAFPRLSKSAVELRAEACGALRQRWTLGSRAEAEER
jgi:hypothetical protein